jgi:hypothetical protein
LSAGKSFFFYHDFDQVKFTAADAKKVIKPLQKLGFDLFLAASSALTGG